MATLDKDVKTSTVTKQVEPSLIPDNLLQQLLPYMIPPVSKITQGYYDLSPMIKSELLSYLKDVKMSESVIRGLNIDNIVKDAVPNFDEAIQRIQQEDKLLSPVKNINSQIQIECRYEAIRVHIGMRYDSNFYRLFPFFLMLDIFFMDEVNTGARGRHGAQDYIIDADTLYINRLISFALTGKLSVEKPVLFVPNKGE